MNRDGSSQDLDDLRARSAQVRQMQRDAYQQRQDPTGFRAQLAWDMRTAQHYQPGHERSAMLYGPKEEPYRAPVRLVDEPRQAPAYTRDPAAPPMTESEAFWSSKLQGTPPSPAPARSVTVKFQNDRADIDIDTDDDQDRADTGPSNGVTPWDDLRSTAGPTRSTWADVQNGNTPLLRALSRSATIATCYSPRASAPDVRGNPIDHGITKDYDEHGNVTAIYERGEVVWRGPASDQ